MGGGAITHTQNTADLLLYLIEAQLPPVSHPWRRELKALLTYWCFSLGAGRSEEVSSLLQPQWRASSFQGGEVRHHIVVCSSKYMYAYLQDPFFLPQVCLILQWEAFTLAQHLLYQEKCLLCYDFQYYLKY